MTDLIEDLVLGEVSSAYIVAPLNEAKTILEDNGYRIIASEEDARLRIMQGKNAPFCKWGNFVDKGVLSVPGKGIFITRESLVLASPDDATRANKNDKEFWVSFEQAERVLSDSVAVPYGLTGIHTEYFGEEEITLFLFGDVAKRYAEFLREGGISGTKEIPLSFQNQGYVNSQEKLLQVNYGLAGLEMLLGLLATGPSEAITMFAECVAEYQPKSLNL